MDSLLAAAARALAAGDVLTALGHVALRSDPPALALRAATPAATVLLLWLAMLALLVIAGWVT